MSEENTSQTNNEQNIVKNESTEANKNVPYDRFSEVNVQKNDALKQVESLQAQLNKVNQANKEKEEAELAKQGEYKTLLDNTKQELSGYKTKAEAWDKYQTSRRESLMERLTDDADKSIADGLTLDKLEMYVEKVSKTNAPKVSQARATSGKAGEFGGYTSHVEWATKDPQGYEQQTKTQKGTGVNIGWEE